MVENKEEIRLEKEFETLEEELDNEEAFLKPFSSGSHPLKILCSIYKGNYWRIAKSNIFYALKYIPCIVQPILIAELINIAVTSLQTGTPPDWKRVIADFAFIFILLVLNIPFNYFHTKNYSKAIRSVEAGLRSSMVRKLQHLSLSYHKEILSGRVQSKIMRDVEAIEGMSTQLFTNFPSVFFSLMAALIVTAFKSLYVFLAFLVLVPIAVTILAVFRRGIVRRNREFRTEIESTSAAVMEMVELIPVTKAHSLESIEADKVNAHLKETAKKGYALDILQSFFGSINWFSGTLFSLICFGFTVFLAIKGKITVGDISLYQNYYGTLVSGINAIIGLVPILTKGMESVKSIGDILGAYDVEDNEGKEQLEVLDGEYRFENVSFCYNKTDADENDQAVINGLDLTVKKGETIALVGESGSGKSTILNLVIGFYKPTDGVLRIDGRDVNTLDLQAYRKHIAVVPQTSVLFSGSIRENITFGNDNVSERELLEAVRAANLEETIAKLPHGLDTQVGEHGDKLSGGQRQRISIARAVIRKPDVIIFDEATSALDSVSEKLIQEAIDNLCRGKTTFIVAHRLSTIRGADKIAVISGGRCVEYGTYDELMEKKGEFYKFKSLQS